MTSPRKRRLSMGAALLMSATACAASGDTSLEQQPGTTQSSAAPSSASPPSSPSPGAARAYRRVWTVSTSGSDSARGTEQAPLRSIGRAISLAQPGDLITVKPGTYAETLEIGPGARDGTADAKITLQGEDRPRIVPASGRWAMLSILRAHWVVEGFEFDAQGKNHAAVAFAGNTEGSELSHCEIHNGAAGAAVTTSANAVGVTIHENHIHHYSKGQVDAHGVLVNPTSRNITIRNNRIHDMSGDSVQCIGPEGFSNDTPARDVLIEGNDMSNNRENAVDIKTCHKVTVRRNQMHGFLESLPGGCAVVVHMSARDITIEDNEIYDAGKGLALGGNHTGPVPTNVVIRSNTFRNMRKGNTLDGTAIRIENSEGARVQANTFTAIQGPALFVGHGSQGATRSLAVEDNLFDTPTAYKLGTQAPGFRSLRNTYLPGVTFLTPQGQHDLSQWQQLGYDTDATLAGSAGL